MAHWGMRAFQVRLSSGSSSCLGWPKFQLRVVTVPVGVDGRSPNLAIRSFREALNTTVVILYCKNLGCGRVS